MTAPTTTTAEKTDKKTKKTSKRNSREVSFDQIREYNGLLVQAYQQAQAESDAVLTPSAKKALNLILKGEFDKILAVPKNKVTNKRSAFSFYADAHRERATKDNPTVPEGLEIRALMHEDWKVLSDEKKLPFVKLAEVDKERHNEQVKTRDELAEKQKATDRVNLMAEVQQRFHELQAPVAAAPAVVARVPETPAAVEAAPKAVKKRTKKEKE